MVIFKLIIEYRMIRLLSILYFFHITIICLTAQEQGLPGTYFIRNHSKGDYNAQSQNWSVDQDTISGIMYFGNNEGLLHFNGTNWEAHPLPNKMIVRAVACNHKGKIFVGGYEEFGYFEVLSNGEYSYISLSEQINIQENEEIWQIIYKGETAYFQSFTTIYEYKNDAITINKAPFLQLYLMNNKNRLVIYVENMGLTEYDNGRYQLTEHGQFFNNKPVIAWFSFDDHEIAGTTLSGLYKKSNNRWQEWDCEASEFVKKNQLNRSHMLCDSLVILGTIRDGAILVNKKGQILDYFNMAQGIQNNTILSLMVDLEKNVWMGLDNGISYIEASSPFRYITDFSGQLGAVYDAVLFGDFLYVGTNHGLFYFPNKGQQTENTNIRFVEGTHGQVWDLMVKDNQLFCGHNSGTFIVSKPGAKAVKASPIAGGWCFAGVDEEWMIQGTYVGIAVFKRKPDGQWDFSHRMTDFYEPVRFIAVRSNDEIWASHNQKGVFKLTPDNEFRKADRVIYYGKKDGFPEEYNIHVFKIRDRIVFTTSKGLYTYDELNDKIIPFDKLNRQCIPNEIPFRIITDQNDNYWFVSNNKAVLYRINSNYDVKLLNYFSTPKALKIDNYENINNLGNYSFFTLDNGLMIFSDKTQKLNTPEPLRLRLLKVEVSLRNNEKVTLLPIQPNIDVVLNSNQNNLTFSFTNTTFYPLPHVYEVMLSGLENEWSLPITSGQKSFTNLPPGKYEFLVRLPSIADSATTLYKFEIRAPWYLTVYAFMGYVLLILLLVRVSFLIHHNHLKKQQKEMEHNQKEELRQQQLLSEQRIMSLEKEKLEAEIFHKSKEISTSALELANKNRILDDLKTEIVQLKNLNKSQASPLNRLIKLIDNNLNQKDDWQLFETNFNHLNSSFYEKLQLDHPELSSKDLRFCAFLKLNLTTKELASLLNISARSLELKRFRLRKKLNLKHEENLVDFLMKYS